MCRRVFAVLALVATSALSFGQWEFRRLSPAAPHGGARATNGEATGGTVANRAYLWSGPGAVPTDLTPAGATDAAVRGVSGSRQAGDYTDANGTVHAAAWSGTAASIQDLSPSGAVLSEALGYGDAVVGHAIFDSEFHAGMWSGPRLGWTDLQPAGSSSSTAFGAEGGIQVGVAVFNGAGQAGYWTGSAASWTPLATNGSLRSDADGIGDGQIVGSVDVPGETHAALWNSLGGSYTDLSVAGYNYSVALAASGGFQAGFVSDDSGLDRAALWNGSAGSYFDLASVAPSSYQLTDAYGLKVVNGEIWVAGGAVNASGEFEAVMWHYSPVPEPASVVVLGLGSALALRWKRRPAANPAGKGR